MKKLNVTKIKKDFPIFKNDPSLIYLDSTATSLKPQSVIDKLNEYYTQYSSNIFRGLYPLSMRATEEYEETRNVVANFLKAQESEEIIFTRNTTESLNLICYTLGEKIVGRNDDIVCSIAEHHSNFVPWQQLAQKKQASFNTIGITFEGVVDLVELEQKISSKTKILALNYVSNVLGVVNPISKITEIARGKNKNIIIVIDAAQAVPHLQIDLSKLDIDFLTFSSHKMLGPTGVGVLWGRKELLETMPPFLFGGEMIDEVRIDTSTFNKIPHKFEAGTPAIGEVIAFKEAIRYLQKIGLKNVKHHEKQLVQYAMKRLTEEFGSNIQFLGPNDYKLKTGIIAFTFKTHHPHDISDILGQDNICVRAGHHCAIPLHNNLSINASTRASFYLYNDKSDVEKLIQGLQKVDKILR